ncbi:hypothetical protein N9A92_01370 [Pirellulales bacterium]|nr:hypothetical protein [Pirellulales bacterium]MDA7899153.1 hypothetical protein [Pirellulales bacterium]
MNSLLCSTLLLITATACGCSYGPTFDGYTKVEEGMSSNEVEEIMGEPFKIVVFPEKGLNYWLHGNEKIRYFLANEPEHLEYFGFHYKINGDEFVINFNPQESKSLSSKKVNNTSYNYRVSHKHKNKKFVPNKINFFENVLPDLNS